MECDEVSFLHSGEISLEGGGDLRTGDLDRCGERQDGEVDTFDRSSFRSHSTEVDVVDFIFLSLLVRTL